MSKTMSKNTLLIVLTGGLFAATSAFAQTSNGNSSNAASMPTASPMQSTDAADGASAPMQKHHMRKSSHKTSVNPSKTPAVETGASAATENGQSK
jgi:hypothetical protein